MLFWMFVRKDTVSAVSTVLFMVSLSLPTYAESSLAHWVAQED